MDPIPNLASTFTVQNVIIFLFGVLGNVLWYRYRARLVPLRWSVQYVRLAAAGHDPRFGKVEVFYNGKPAVNLHFATVQVVNDSNSDLRDVVINIAFSDGSRMLASQGALVGSLQSIPFTNEFQSMVNRFVKDQDPTTLADLWAHRDYQIPVLNRGTKTNFVILLTRDDAAEPKVQIACDHLGVRLKPLPLDRMLWDVSLKQAVILGIPGSLLLVFVITSYLHSIWLVGLASWLAGVAAGLIGAALVVVWRWFTRLIG